MKLILEKKMNLIQILMHFFQEYFFQLRGLISVTHTEVGEMANSLVALVLYIFVQTLYNSRQLMQKLLF